jgi:hypothetical protein
MKQTALVIAVAAFSLASCKKDRTCTCTYTHSWTSNADVQVTTYTKVTKKTALATCNSGTSYDLSDPSKIDTRTCTLK